MVPMLGGRFQLTDLLAGGDLGMVWKALDEGTGRTVAVKVIHPHLASDPRLADRFLRARRELTALWHPGIARLLDVVVDADSLALVSDLVPGTDLARWPARYGPISAGMARDVAESIADALVAAHRAGMVHGDIKPSNVVAPPPGGESARLTDFSVAVLVRAGRRTNGSHSAPWYRAPEVTDGVVPAPASDVYALGAVLADLLTGGPWLEERDSGLLHRLRDLGIDCMRAEPNRRPTAIEAYQALREMPSGRSGAPTGRPIVPQAPLGNRADSPISDGGPAGSTGIGAAHLERTRRRPFLRRPAGLVTMVGALLALIAVVPVVQAVRHAVGPALASPPPSADVSSAGTSSASPSSAGRSSAGAAAAPRLPSSATERSLSGGAEFVRYWYTVLTSAEATGDVTELVRVTSPDCASCAQAIGAIRSGYADGGSIRGGTYLVRKVTNNSLWTLDRPVFDVTIDRSPRVTVDRAGVARDRVESLTFANCVAVLEWSNDRWRLLELPTTGCLA